MLRQNIQVAEIAFYIVCRNHCNIQGTLIVFLYCLQESPFPGVTQTPVSKLLKKVENANTGSVMSIPKHHKKVQYLSAAFSFFLSISS